MGPRPISKRVKRHLLAATLLLLLAGCGYIPFSGGELEGNVVQVPADWSQLSRVDIIQLETNPAEPYSVKLWVVDLGASLYVHAGANRATWVENIEKNADVRLLSAESIYELRATRVQDAGEFAQFSDAYEAKYSTRPRNENVAEVYVFRLEARQ